MASHLTTLIKRVRAIPHKFKSESIFFSKLVNLAEYLHYESDYSEFEERKAKALLKIHNLDFLLEIDDDDGFERAIRHFIAQKNGTRICMRCGRSLTNPDSIRRGYGMECYSKREIMDKTKLSDFFDLLKGDEDK